MGKMYVLTCCLNGCDPKKWEWLHKFSVLVLSLSMLFLSYMLSDRATNIFIKLIFQLLPVSLITC